MIDFTTQAAALTDEVIARRRDLHMHPEIAFEEVRTAGIVAQELTALGMEVQTGIGKTGVIGMLEGAHDGPTVLVRADMDALPIQEENELDFASTTPNRMHACGHDGHTSIALAVAKLLNQRKDDMHGRIKFVFQPAEEVGRGAAAMIQDGALTDPRPDVTVGLHLWNNLPYGMIGAADGGVMAGATIFTITVKGKGAHAANPHTGIDPVVCAAHMVTAFQTIISRGIDPMDTGVISVTQVKAGDAYNVIPQKAELRGTIRTFDKDVRDFISDRMTEIVHNLAAAMQCTAEITIEHVTIPVINDPEVGAKLRAIFEQTPGVTGFDLNARTMGAEDVSYFMDDIPGFYFFVGAQDQTQDTYYGHHHPRFSFDERALSLGVALLTAAAAAYVLPEG